MKTKTRIFTTVFSMLIALFTHNGNAKPLHDETVTFKVYGNCEMCKKRIESVLTKNTAIKSAIWNVETKMIQIVYNPHVLTVDQIHKIVADAGHDTDKLKAPDAVYKKLPGCCQYERKK